MREVFANDRRGDPLAVEAAHADPVVEPDRAVRCLLDRADLVVAQAVSSGEVPNAITTDAADALEVAAEPVVPRAVLQDRAHAGIVRAVMPRRVGKREELWRDGLSGPTSIGRAADQGQRREKRNDPRMNDAVWSHGRALYSVGERDHAGPGHRPGLPVLGLHLESLSDRGHHARSGRTRAAKRERPGREARAFTFDLLARQFRARLLK